LLYTMCDPPNVAGATACTPMMTVMALLQRGDVHLGFIGGAEVDRFGNVNTTSIGDPSAPTIRLPGSGGGADIAALARRLIVIMEHQRRRFRERVDYITSPGFGDGPGWRERVGLPRGGPSALITTLGTFRFPPETCEATLTSVHPGASLPDVQAQTQWPLATLDPLGITAPPTSQELAVIREYDPDHFWTG
jgi:glutaconate CoA-transferase subunit B